MGAGASTLLPKLIDQQQAKAVANDRLDEAAFDAATVDGRVSRAVLMEISSWLQAIRDGAKKLDLTGKRIGDVGARALAASLEKNTTLSDLGLDANEIGDDGARALAASLEKNTTLVVLDLYGNKIGDDGARALAASLERNTTLTTLDLNGNKIGDDGARALAASLEKNTTLEVLDLDDNEIGDDGARALAASLEKNTTLMTLDLHGNGIGDDGARALAASLEKNMLEHRLRLEKNMLELRDELRRQTEELKALLKKFKAVRARFARDRAFRVAMRFCRRGFAVLATACPFFRLLDLSIELDALRGASDHADLLLELLRSGTAVDQPDPLLQQDR